MTEADTNSSEAKQTFLSLNLMDTKSALGVAGLCSGLWLPQLLILMNGMFASNRLKVQEISRSQLGFAILFVVCYCTLVIYCLRSTYPDIARLADDYLRGQTTTSNSANQTYELEIRVFGPIRAVLEYAAPLSAVCSLIVSWAVSLKAEE